jgi:GAF domain-containing protein
MKAPSPPPDELHRLDALRSLTLLDTRPEADFDAVVALGKSLFAVPICLISLIDADRQWFKAKIGLDAAQTTRAISFCGHAILNPQVFVVLDATKDERFHDNPLVVGPPFIRFYAGAPIELPSGYRIGTVCVIGLEPRTAFGPEEQQRLQSLAALALNAIAVRALRRELDGSRAEADRYQAVLQMTAVPFAFVDEAGLIRESNPAFAALCGDDAPEGRPVSEALTIGGWSPQGMDSQGVTEVTITAGAGGTALRVIRDAEGFLFIADRGAPASA